MPNDERLDELLLQWEESVEAGRPTPAEELCRDHPELVDELRRRIDALRDMGWLSDLAGDGRDVPLRPEGRHAILAPGSEPIPGYRLLRCVGRGGFAEVWQATGPGGVSLAMKFVPKAEGEASVEWKAVEALKDVRHANLLPMFGAWETPDNFVVAMELAERTLMDRWREAAGQGLPGVPREELLKYVGQAADGIDCLHARGVQHRDIKPRNLLLVGGSVKVADFGLARALAHSVTGHTGALTVAYAAPEFFEGRTTRHSDQYGLAVTYCQLRGGRLPFEGSPASVVAGHLHRPPDLSMLPKEERPAVARALAKRPERRWPSCRAFVAGIQYGHGAPAGRLSRSRLLGAVLVCSVLGALAVACLLWHLASTSPGRLRLVRSFEPPPAPGNIRSVAVGFVGEPWNRVVALSNGSGGPTLWDVQTGAVLRRLPSVAGPCVALAPFSAPMGVTGDDDGDVVLWDLAGGSEVRRFTGHQASVSSVAFSLDGRQVLSGACDMTVRLWDRETGKELCCCRGHTSVVTSVAFSPDGRRALSAGWDGTVRLWNLERGEQLRRFDGHVSRVMSVAFSPDGRNGLSGGFDGSVRRWDLEGGREAARFDADGDQVRGVSFARKGRILGVGERNLRIWDGASGHLLSCSTALPSAGQAAALFDMEGATYAVIGTERDGLSLWQLPNE